MKKLFIYLAIFSFDTLCSQNDLKTDLAQSYWAKSDSFYSINFDSCLIYTKKAAEEYKKTNQWSQNVFCLNSVATLYFQNGNYEKSNLFQDSAYHTAITHLDNTDSNLINLYNNLGATERFKGNFDKSIYYIRKALELSSILNTGETSDLYNLLSLTYILKGDYKPALKCLKFSLNQNLERNNIFSLAETYSINGYCNLKLKKFKISVSDLKKSINYYKKVNTKNPRFIEFKILKNKYYLMENFLLLADFSKYEKEAFSYEKKLNTLQVDHLTKANYYFLKAKYEFKLNRLNECLLNLDLSYNLYSNAFNSFNHPNQIKLLQLKAQAIANLNHNTNALNIINTTLPSEYNANYNKIQLIESIKIKSNILKKINKPNYESFLLLSSLLKSLRLENSTASHKDFWANENLNIYQDAIATFIDNDDIESAFTFAEENKSNLLVQSLNDIEAKSYANIPAELLEKENDLRAKLQFYQKKKFELENSDNIDSTKLIDYFELITTTEFAIDEIVDTLESHYPEYYELKYNEEDLKAADIKNILDDKTAFIEYFVGKDSAYVFTITKDNISVNSLDILSDSTNIFLKYYQSISDPNVSATFLDSHSKSTYKLVLEKALENINSNIQDLIIVPDDILNNLPFELMKNEKDEYLGFKYNIHYQYSGRLWRLLKNRKSFDKKYDFLGYAYNSDNVNYIAERACATMETGNLLCSDKEIQNIATILKDKSLLLKNANKDDILKNASQSRIVHLATHSCLDSENSDYSRIFFNDGYITNIDLQLQTMNADLAVLSACESGYGELIKGEGAMSISKGFFHAGCKSTLVSLWPVDDCSTSEFMGHFYTYLNEGLQKDVALKKAKQTYLETAHPSRTHPYYWAGFILIGDNAAVFGNGGGYLFWVMGFLGLLVFGWCIKKV